MKKLFTSSVLDSVLSVAIVFLFANTSSAHEFCATTNTQLRAALAAASDGGANENEVNQINVAAGTYLTTDVDDRFLYKNTSSTSGLHLWGGFNSDCSRLGENAVDTVFDGAGVTQVLVVRSAAGIVDLLNFTVQNGNTNQPGAGISVNDTDDVSGDVLMRNLIIRNNHTSSVNGGFRAFARNGHTLYFDDNIVVGNSADTGNGAGQLFGEAQVYARYDTIALNSGMSATVGGMSCGGSPGCEIANSVFWQNSTSDLSLSTTATLYFNDIGVLAGTAPLSNIGALNADPVFVNSADGDFHLGTGSPLLGVSTYRDSSSDNDVEGHPLPQTGRTDIGGFEETIFSDGLESP